MTISLMERPNEAVAAKIEEVLVGGDLSKLSPTERVSLYNAVCKSLGLNPLTKPFAFIQLSGKLTLYALKDCTEQLRKIHGVSITDLKSERLEDVFVVTAKALDKTGRIDAATGAVPIGNARGEALANLLMKAETKAKRRATLSICGLGMLDESELDTMPAAPTYSVEAPAMVPAIGPVESRVDAPTASAGDSPSSPPLDAEPTPHMDLPDGCVLIASVRGVDGQKELVLFTGESHRIYKEQLVSIAVQCCQDRIPVKLTLKESASHNFYVTMIVPVPQGKKAHADSVPDFAKPLDPKEPLPF